MRTVQVTYTDQSVVDNDYLDAATALAMFRAYQHEVDNPEPDAPPRVTRVAYVSGPARTRYRPMLVPTGADDTEGSTR